MKAAPGNRSSGACTNSLWGQTTMSRAGTTGFIVAPPADHSFPCTYSSNCCTEKPDWPRSKSGLCQRRSCDEYRERNTDSCKLKSLACGTTSRRGPRVQVSSWGPVHSWTALDSCLVEGLRRWKNGSFRSHHIYKSQWPTWHLAIKTNKSKHYFC